jgi:filamentous hemagglutinin family protein
MKQELRSAIRSILAIQPLAMLALASPVNVAAAAELPVVCSGGCFTPGRTDPVSFVTSGAASVSTAGNTMTVDQSTDRAVLNWASFNVSADGRVVFNQPRSTSITLNRIYDASPSRVFGTVEANGQIYLVNPNGMVFGRTARINAAGILASSLSISDENFAAGLLAPELIQNRRPALSSDGRVYAMDSEGRVTTENGQPVEVKLVVEEGAKLESRGAGGRVMLASREIDNAGSVASPDGQVILAAGDQVYLQASTDPKLRGLLVEVAAGGEAWNRMTGDISAAHGNVTVVGLAVNQNGRVSASTTVSANGSVRLLARDNPAFINNPDFSVSLGAGQNGGKLEVGDTSRIEVLPDLEDDGTAVDDQEQLASRIEMSAREIFMRSGSSITAPAGDLFVSAAANPSVPGAYDPSARIRVESGVSVDLSGSDVELPMSTNQVTVELRANELRDSPNQRNGALRGQTVVVDARIGTPLADVSGALAAIPKGVGERTSHGGRSVFNSEGDVVIADGARFDVSGGVLSFAGGPVATSQLIGADGRLYDIGEADPTRTYVGILNPTFRRADDRWGFVQTATGPGVAGYRQGYLHGSDAGTVQFAAPSMIMNGSLRANTVIGPYQRLQDQQPLGGQLVIGLPEGLGSSLLDYRAPSVTLSLQGSTLPVGDDGSLSSELTLLLPTDYLAHGFTRTAIYSNGRITIPESTPLNLTAGSSLTLRAEQVEIRADINSAGGAISATAVDTVGTGSMLGRFGVTVGDGVTLDVQGNWSNDQQAALLDPFGLPTSSIHTDGGSIALGLDVDESELVLGDQVRLLANAGAWRRQDGEVQGGNGGSISIDASALHGALELGEGLQVQAFGMLGAEGGKFALTAPLIEVASASSWSRAQRLDQLPPTQPPEPTDPLAPEPETEYLQIGTSLFSDYGFGSVSLIASGLLDRTTDGDALRITGDTEILARANVLQLSDASVSAGNARDVSTLARIVEPLEFDRQGMHLSFGVTPSGSITPDRTGRLSLQSGASILTDPGSSVSFSSVGGIDVDGAIRARGGSINMLVDLPEEDVDTGYRPDIGLRLGQNALLDVSGTAVYQPVGDGLLQGTIHDGGSVTLQANRGHVVVEQGALIDVSGTAAALDRNLSTTGLTRSVIGSNAGVLSLIAPEAIAFNGTFRAHAGVGDTGPATGGELVMRLSRMRGFGPGPTEEVQATFPTDPRMLRVTEQDIAIGGQPPNGLALLSRDVIDDSGIDALTLEADGRIEFDSTTLSMGRRIVLDSPEIVARSGADVSLSAPYLAIGNSLLRNAVTPTQGTGSFKFQGEFIEAIGAVSLSGAATTILSSSTDIRLRELLDGTGRAGHLQSAGDLTLRATQIYPSTLSSYALSALGDEATLRIESSAAPGTTPLTAGGKLTLTAANIEQFGNLRAPFGSIDLNATESLVLGAGSMTSVSGDGALIPFGRVENGEWIYQTADRVVQTAIPERRIGLNAPSIDQDKDAKLDLQGGGDLYAYEWIPGTGGSRDALSAGIQQGDTFTAFGRFAILPSQRGQFAPYDPQELANYDLQVGDSVYLSGIPGLEAGYYALLPARYALLPGAMLIEPVANTNDIQPGSQTTLPDGTPVVAGYRSFGSTGLGGTRYTGFAVRAGTQGRDLAEYQDHLASKFFADRATRLEEQTPPVLPADAGTLSLLATTSLDMRGIVDVSAGSGGRAGRVEIAGASVEIVNTVSAGADSVQIAASVLNTWNPGELWIGGTKRGETVDVISDRVRVADGVNVSAGEVVLIANSDVEVGAGATVASTSGSSGATVARDQLGEANIRLGNDDAGAAVLAVSDRNLYNIVRAPNDPESGSITTASDSTLSTGGALLANAPANVALHGDIRARDAVWQLGSSTVRFAEAAHDDGLNISAALMARMQDAGVLQIVSDDAIEFSYAVSLGTSGRMDELTLQANSVRGLSGANVSLAADRVTLVSTGTNAAAADPSIGSGTLSIAANTIHLVGKDAERVGADGQPLEPDPNAVALQKHLSIEGFAASSLTATDEIRGVGDIRARFGGDLNMTAGRVTAASGEHTFIDVAQGAVRISGNGTASASSAEILGGALSITARDITHEGTLFLPSGLVTLEATENLSVGGTGVIDVSGQLVKAADRTLGTSGGTVRLASGGGVTTAAGSRIDVSGATDADAGRLSIHAGGNASLAGNLRGQAGSATATGGASDIYAGTLANSRSLIAGLQTGGFTEKQALHVGAGDLTLGAGETVTAREIEWTTDQGQVSIDGTMVAPSQARRSSIRLYGADGVTLGSTAVLNADGAAGVRFGGDIELGSSRGALAVNAGSVISGRGDEHNGSLRLRAAAVGGDVSITSLAGTIQNVDDVVVEAVRSFDVPGAVSSIEYDAIRNDIAAYMAAAGSTIRNRLGNGVRVEAGAELRHDGDLALDGLDLSSWRFDDNPIALSVRASGSITVNGSISDGVTFEALNPDRPDLSYPVLMSGNSATLRFAAGARLDSANPNAVTRNAAADFVVGPSAIIRTGTGDINVNAARDVRFNAGSSIYTTGIAGSATQFVTTPSGGSFNFADRGGNVAIVAGNDVVTEAGAEVSQSVSAWQRRQQGTLPDAPTPRNTQWGIDLNAFAWNLGTLGGGDLSIAADRDVTNIAATAADSAIEFDKGQLTRFGGGSLSITAGRDVNSAMLYVARSEGRIVADGGLGMTRQSTEFTPLGSLLMLGEAQVKVVAREDINLEKMFNPTVLVQQGVANAQRSLFFTYGDHSGIDIRSNGGDVNLQATAAADRLAAYIGDVVSRGNITAMKIMPSSLVMQSMTGDVNLLAGDISLFPSDTGQLDIFAGRDFKADPGATINMADLAAGDVATPLRPTTSPEFSQYTLGVVGSARHINDNRPASITAGRDIVGQSINVAKSAHMVAGRDIIDTTLKAQNLRPTDVTTVQAGRDIRYAPNLVTAQMSVGGPGRFDVISGRHLDLGFSAGLTTTGRLLNAAIASEEGADLNVLVGMGRDMDGNAFVDDVIADSAALREALQKFMITRTGNASLSYDQAVAGFKALDSSTQRPLLMGLFYDELVASGREANNDPDAGFERGYHAIDALFPGSRPAEGETNPYQGDLTMAFSRIYTLSGGDISIAVPGGLVNVGLANPPTTVAPREPYQLGIVAQRAGDVHIFTNDDVLVNQSRVFTLLGGDIAIWSTFGDIDAGRGSKSSVSAPPPGVLVDASGQVTLNFAGAVAGSGIRTIVTDETVEPGDVDLIAPQGIVNAGDAGIGSAGNLNIAAAQVVGLDNIQVGGVSTGVPAESSGLGASLASVSAAASSSSSAAEAATEDDDESDQTQASLAQTAMSWLEVFVVGLGEEGCKTDDVECLKRQPLN